MNKRLIIISAIILLVLAGVGVLLAIAVKRQNAKKVPVVTEQIKKVLDEPVISPVASFDNSAIWYFNSEGRLFRVNLDGSGLTEFPLPALASGTLRKVLWPASGSDFIAVSGTGTGEAKNLYDSSNKIYTVLPGNIQSLDWLPDSKRIVYIWKSSDNVHQQLAVANSDGTGFQTIKEVFWPDLAVKASPDGKMALLYRQTMQDLNKVYAADLTTGLISTVIDSGKNIGATWISPTRFIFAQSSLTSYPKLYLYDMTNKQVVDLGINTLLDKIVVDKTGKALYAAVPKKDNTGDTFLTVDLTTYKQDTYFEPDTTLRASGLFLVGGQVYFINSQDQKLYTITK